MEMYKKVLLLCVTLMFVGVAQADYFWIGDPAGDNYNDGTNWSLSARGAPANALPGSGDTVYIESILADWAGVPTDPIDPKTLPPGADANYILVCKQTQAAKSWYNWTEQIININSAVTCRNFRGADSADKFARSTVNILNGGNWNIGRNLDVARNAYAEGEVNQYAGSTLTVGRTFGLSYHGYRTVFNMYGGTTTVGAGYAIGVPDGWLGGWSMDNYLGDLYYDDTNDEVNNGSYHTTADSDYPKDLAMTRLNIYGGTITADVINVGTLYNAPKDVVNITNGTIILRGDKRAQTQPLIDGGYIVAWDGALPVKMEYDVPTNTTVLTPEPTTMLMLGLGSLCLIRRRKA